ncbi:hypothetical protein KC339_g17335, partial [Hortaea werneckii]
MEDTDKISRSAAAPVVIGLYGLPGSGKTTLMRRLQQDLPSDSYSFYEGSEVLGGLVEGGIDAFKNLAPKEQATLRQRAIEQIGEQCTLARRTGLVTGHLMFWSDEKGAPTPVYTDADLATFSHIIYLDAMAEEIAGRCTSDTSRSRITHSLSVIEEWKEKEKSTLRDLCSRNEILYYTLTGAATSTKAKQLCLDFARHSPEYNVECAAQALDAIFERDAGPVNASQTTLVFDADKTLAPFDTGRMFHDAAVRKFPTVDANFLETLFGGSLGYSYYAFRQLVLTYDEKVTDGSFEELYFEVASAVKLYPEMMSLLKCAAITPHITAIVVTSGLKAIWEKVLELAKLDNVVQVIGGGRLCDGYIVNAAVKAHLVSRLRRTYHQYVWVFGDGPLDVLMMQEADQAIVVVGDEESRSRSMDSALEQALATAPVRVRQALLPGTVQPRLDLAQLPPCFLESEQFIRELVLPRF